MSIWMIISSVLSVFCLGLFFYLVSLKRQMKKIQKELLLTKQQSYNRQIRIPLFDKELTDMTIQINDNLDYQRQLKRNAWQAEDQLKKSISDIAHDLRTPLTVVKGNLQMLDTSSMTERNQNYLKICKDKLDVLKDMVDDFFEMSVLESDSTPVSLSEINITNLLMQFVIDHETLIRGHSLNPDIRLPEKSVTILADKQMLERMLGNLLNNVVKYARDSFILAVETDKAVTMEKPLKNAVCRIIFSNQITDDEDWKPEHLFERTYRGSKERHGSGAGLGLYIVRLLAQKQGAQVYAKKKDGWLEIYMVFPVKEHF